MCKTIVCGRCYKAIKMLKNVTYSSVLACDIKYEDDDEIATAHRANIVLCNECANKLDIFLFNNN